VSQGHFNCSNNEFSVSVVETSDAKRETKRDSIFILFIIVGGEREFLTRIISCLLLLRDCAEVIAFSFLSLDLLKAVYFHNRPEIY
jgi:hypothetical protein